MSRKIPTNRLITIPEIGFTTGFVLGLGVLAFTSLYIFLPPKYHGDLLFFAAACAAAGQLAAAFYSAKVLEFTVQTQRETLSTGTTSKAENDKRYFLEKSQEFAARWNNANLFHVRQHCEEIVQNRSNQEAIKDKIDGDKNFSANIKHVLNFLEEMALCVNQQACNEEIAKALFCGIVINVWHATEFFVKEQRTSRGRPQIWRELESLYGRWK